MTALSAAPPQGGAEPPELLRVRRVPRTWSERHRFLLGYIRGYAVAVAAPTSIRTIDMQLIDSVFGMGGGYVLDFSDRTFSAFFRDEIGVNIDDRRYSAEGTSKAKRLRYFLKTCEPSVRIRTLTALWEYRETIRRRSGAAETFPRAEAEFSALIERLAGRPTRKPPVPQPPSPTSIDTANAHALRDRLLAVTQMAPQSRGFAYERFWHELFAINHLAPRPPFRVVGEQIDGSFELSGETYLLEAKWTGLPVGAADLRAFHGKVEDKSAWSRGLFVSESGFSEEGLLAFGGGKRVVCMDGLDLHDMLDRSLSFVDVMAKKVRRYAETGYPFVRVRDLFT